MLEVRDLSVSFGGVAALSGVSFDVPPKRIVGLIGPNGAGKTTALNCISHYIKPARGSVRFENVDLLKRGPHDIVRLGITRTFQHLELFNSMTTLDNLLVAQHTQDTTSLLGELLPIPFFRRSDRLARERARETMRFLDLLEFEEWPVGALAYGVRKRLDLARALVTRAKLVLLDEPAAGLTNEEMGTLGELIRRVRDQLDTAVLLVEHHMSLVMEVSDALVVLNFGEKIAEGSPAEVQRMPQVLEAYLGGRS